MPNPFINKAFDVEHALGLHAFSFATLPAFALYDDEVVAGLTLQTPNLHIYLVGLVPKIDFVNASQVGNNLVTEFECRDGRYELRWPLEPGYKVCQNLDSSWYVLASDGTRMFPSEDAMAWRLAHELRIRDFEVLYIGQAYGTGGSRNAVDRLLKHETVQKISLTGVPKDQSLTVLMLSIQPDNRIMTVFNPHAKDKTKGQERIQAGLDKLYNTDEVERITLYEAALIRYFQPAFNKTFKDSFPSTNLKVLKDCYDKDFSAIVAEICIDELPFWLCSGSVAPAAYHIAKHDLHAESDRKVFFGL